MKWKVILNARGPHNSGFSRREATVEAADQFDAVRQVAGIAKEYQVIAVYEVAGATA